MAISSGCSFGFFMGIGAVIRSGEMKERKAIENNDYIINIYDENSQ